MFNLLKYTFTGLLFSGLFILLYFETVFIGGVKLAILWKTPLLIFLLLYFFPIASKQGTVPAFVAFGMLLALKYFFSLSSFQYPAASIAACAKFSIFFLLFIYLKNRYNKETLIKMGNHISIFIVISFAPFMLGLLDSLGRSTNLSTYANITGNSLIGFFQNPHAAGMTLAVALLIIFNRLMSEKNNKAKIFLLVILGLGIIEMFLTMVRTSMVMFIFGMLFMSMKYFKPKHIFVLIVASLIAISYVTTHYQDSPMLQAMWVRLQGDTKYIDYSSYGSGRLKIAGVAVESWQSEGITGILIGLGPELAKDKMERVMGQRLTAHNGFIQVLQSEGLIGFALFLIFLYHLFKYILKHKKSEFHAVSLSIFIAYIVAMLLQGGNMFVLYVLFSIYLSILSKSNIWPASKHINIHRDVSRPNRQTSSDLTSK